MHHELGPAKTMDQNESSTPCIDYVSYFHDSDEKSKQFLNFVFIFIYVCLYVHHTHACNT